MISAIPKSATPKYECCLHSTKDASLLGPAQIDQSYLAYCLRTCTKYLQMLLSLEPECSFMHLVLYFPKPRPGSPIHLSYDTAILLVTVPILPYSSSKTRRFVRINQRPSAFFKSGLFLIKRTHVSNHKSSNHSRSVLIFPS